MIRVTGGSMRGRGVESPPRSKQIRPTASVMRESIFNKIQAYLPGCRFMDLFAGSGIMGLEALSRGADFLLSVEADTEQCRVIRKNYAAIGLKESQAKVITHDVGALLKLTCREEAFDVIFMDPPYGYRHLPELVEHCVSHGWAKPDSVIIVEHGNRDADLPGFVRKTYGDTSVSIRYLESEES